MSAGGLPIIVLKDGSAQTKGRDAQKNNIAAAKLISEVVKTSLGPRGMDKMLVDGMGDVTISNDGATILKEIDVQHPAAKMMVEISKATDNEVGDGTTSSVVLAGALLAKAEDLVLKEVHPTVIVDGYRRAADKALSILNKIAKNIDVNNKDWLRKVAKTSLYSKLVSEDSDQLADIVVDAVLLVAEKDGEKYTVDQNNIKTEKKSGGSIASTKLIRGIVLDKEIAHSGMPKKVQKAKIALINNPMEVEKTEFTAEIRISDPDQMKQFLDEENRILKDMVNKIASLGVTFVACQKGIDEVAQHFLANRGISAVRRVKESDMAKLAKATGGRIVSNLEDLSKKDLGYAGEIEERKIEDDKMTFIEGAKDAKSVTLMVRGSSKRVVDEAERSIHDAVMVVKDVLQNPAVVAGGGSVEAELSYQILKWSEKLSGREQLAVQAFAEALEEIPLSLAENAGMDSLDIQVELKSAHSEGDKWIGVDAMNGKVGDLFKLNVIEPLAVKQQVIKSATEAAGMILRIDDVISSGKKPAGPPGGGMGGGPMPGMGGMGGMGGMPGMM